MIEPALVAAGLTGAWVRTVQGLVFLVAIIFYLTMDEPQRRTAFFGRMGLRREFGGRSADKAGPAARGGAGGPQE